jgi:hypothetical protein
MLLESNNKNKTRKFIEEALTRDDNLIIIKGGINKYVDYLIDTPIESINNILFNFSETGEPSDTPLVEIGRLSNIRDPSGIRETSDIRQLETPSEIPLSEIGLGLGRLSNIREPSETDPSSTLGRQIIKPSSMITVVMFITVVMIFFLTEGPAISGIEIPDIVFQMVVMMMSRMIGEPGTAELPHAVNEKSIKPSRIRILVTFVMVFMILSLIGPQEMKIEEIDLFETLSSVTRPEPSELQQVENERINRTIRNNI